MGCKSDHSLITGWSQNTKNLLVTEGHTKANDITFIPLSIDQTYWILRGFWRMGYSIY